MTAEPRPHRVRVLVVALMVPLVLWAALPIGSSAAPSRSTLSRLHGKIGALQQKIGAKKGAEHTLSTQIAGYTDRIGHLQGRISSLDARVRAIQADLETKLAGLARVRGDLRGQRARLVHLRIRLSQAMSVLRRRMVEIYEADPPDVVSVIFDSKGFADLVERGEFIKRISQQDNSIIDVVRAAKTDATATAKALVTLETRQHAVTAQIATRRDAVARAKQALIDTRVGYQKTKDGKAAALRKVRTDRGALENHVSELEAASQRVADRLAALQRAPAPTTGGPAPQGSGRFIFPVNGPITGAFGETRPGHIHTGIDIAVPIGTPIKAADAGRVVLMQGAGESGGYGNFTCIQHTATLSSCYAHQSSFATSVGADVTQGQVIGYVGMTGNTTGPHLHFEARVNGAPVNPLGYL